jgi:hypothetical protein
MFVMIYQTPQHHISEYLYDYTAVITSNLTQSCNLNNNIYEDMQFCKREWCWCLHVWNTICSVSNNPVMNFRLLRNGPMHKDILTAKVNIQRICIIYHLHATQIYPEGHKIHYIHFKWTRMEKTWEMRWWNSWCNHYVYWN